MINSVKITDLGNAVSISFKEDKENAWVSIVDEEDKNKIRIMKNNYAKKGVPHFAQYFYDWSDEDNDVYIQKYIEEKGPRLQHVNNIIAFLQPLVSSKKIYHLGVNCFAGVSRSTAVGIIAWVMQGKTPEQALQEIVQVRPQAWPNLRMLNFASTTLGINLVQPIKDWKANSFSSIWLPQN
jgi:predicted protein tyrosine phosphatase